MSEEKQVEEMAKVIKSSLEGLGSGNFNFTGDEFSIMLAKAIYAAGYRKQSKNVIELPCKVGDMIYLPWEFDGIKSIAYLTVTHIIFGREHNYVKTDFDTDDEAYYDKYQCGRYEFEDFGEIVFLTSEEAQKALAKMKGGEQE
jgi:hypothetical protein